MNYAELFRDLKTKTKMYVPCRSYEVLTAFIIGYDTACEYKILEGFREWLTYKYHSPNNFVFFRQVEFVFKNGDFKKEIDENDLIDFLFDLFSEFDKERKSIGIENIMNKYDKYISKKGW